MDQKVSDRARKPGSGRLPAEEAARLPDRLLDAAMAVFLDQGYAQTTMDRIVRAAGASTKTVYERYRNKHDILTAAVRRLVEQGLPLVIEDIEASARQAEPHAFLVAVGDRLATLATGAEALGLYRLAIGESQRFPDLARLYTEGPGRIVMVIARILERWHAMGRLRLNGDPEATAGAYLDLMITTPRHRAIMGKPLSRAALKAHVAANVDIFLSGCGRLEG